MSTHAIGTSVPATNLVTIQNGKPATTSNVIAVTFGKRHADVLRAVNNLECSPEFNQRNFAPVEFTDEKGEKRPSYIVSRDGFMFLAMGFTGKEAAKWKEQFIDAFNAMEVELKRISDESRTAYTANPGDVLNAAQAEQLRLTLKSSCDKLPKDKQGAFMIKAWSKLKSHFGVSYRKIPQSEFTEALSLVTRHAIEWELLDAPTVKDIDPRALMLSGNATPTVPVAQQVRDAIDHRAWEMAREAYELSREHLARAVAAGAERGHPQRKMNEQSALKIIDETNLGRALASKHYNEFHICMDLLKTVQNHAAKSMAALSLDIENGMTK